MNIEIFFWYWNFRIQILIVCVDSFINETLFLWYLKIFYKELKNIPGFIYNIVVLFINRWLQKNSCDDRFAMSYLKTRASCYQAVGLLGVIHLLFVGRQIAFYLYLDKLRKSTRRYLRAICGSSEPNNLYCRGGKS